MVRDDVQDEVGCAPDQFEDVNLKGLVAEYLTAETAAVSMQVTYDEVNGEPYQ